VSRIGYEMGARTNEQNWMLGHIAEARNIKYFGTIKDSRRDPVEAQNSKVNRKNEKKVNNTSVPTGSVANAVQNDVVGGIRVIKYRGSHQASPGVAEIILSSKITSIAEILLEIHILRS